MAFFAQVPAEQNIGGMIGQGIAGGMQRRGEADLAQKLNLEKLEKEYALKGQNELQRLMYNKQFDSQVGQSMAEILEKRGVPKDLAQMYGLANTGGRTAILKDILELDQRGLLGEKPNAISSAPKDESYKPTDQIIKDNTKASFEWPELPEEKGLKPSERVARENKIDQQNFKIINDNNDQLKNNKLESMDLELLQNLNNKGTLPEGLGRLDIDPKSGRIIIPALANEDTQLYAKTINKFTNRAKDSYGARVTNFELDQFMQQLATLANTKEGRELILSKSLILNKINALDHEALNEVYSHYGPNKIRAGEAQNIANKIKASKEKELIEQYKDVENSINDYMKNPPQTNETKRPSLEEFLR